MAENIYGVIKPFHVVSKFLGFMMFSIDERTLRLTLRKCDVIFITLTVILNGSINFIYWSVPFEPGYKRSEIISSSVPWLMYANYAFYTLTMIWTILARKQLIFIIQKLHKIDMQLKCFSIKFDYHRQRLNVIKAIFSVFAIEASIFTFIIGSRSYYQLHFNINSDLFVFWCIVCGTELMLVFIFCAIATYQRFRTINDLIK